MAKVTPNDIWNALQEASQQPPTPPPQPPLTDPIAFNSYAFTSQYLAWRLVEKVRALPSITGEELLELVDDLTGEPEQSLLANKAIRTIATEAISPTLDGIHTAFYVFRRTHGL